MRKLRSPRDGIDSPFGARRLFNPIALFAKGEAGAWYEPSDTTAFLSTTDLTPCGETDPCGFLLDKSQGAGYSGGSFTGLGSELVEDGNWTAFGVAGGVETPGRVTVTDGEITLDVSGVNTAAQVGFTTVVGTWYRVEFECATNPFRFWAGPTDTEFAVDTARRVVNASSATGTFEAVFQATATTTYFNLHGDDGGDNIYVFDNVTIKELSGNHASQGTAAARPTLERTAGGLWYLHDDEVDDVLNWSAPSGTYTVARVNSAGTVTIQTSQSLNGDTDILIDAETVGYVAVDRALTASETSKLTSYLEALAS